MSEKQPMTKLADVKPGTVFCFSDCPMCLCLRMEGRAWVQLPQASYFRVAEGDKWMDYDVLELGAFHYQEWSAALFRDLVRGDRQYLIGGKHYVFVESDRPPS